MKNDLPEIGGAQLSATSPNQRYVLIGLGDKTLLRLAPRGCFVNDVLTDVKKRGAGQSVEMLGVGIVTLEPAPKKSALMKLFSSGEGVIRLKPDDTGLKREPDTKVTLAIMARHFNNYKIEVE